MTNSKLEEAFDQLKIEVTTANLLWIEPGFWPDVESNDPHFTWCGNGPQGKEPARFSMYLNDNKTNVVSFVTWADFNDPGIESEHFINYKRYLELNNWL